MWPEDVACIGLLRLAAAGLAAAEDVPRVVLFLGCPEFSCVIVFFTI